MDQENKVNVKENYSGILERVRRAAIGCGRDPDEITLISVSKTKPVDLIEDALAAGSRDFGENRVQELRDKYEYFQTEHPEYSDIKWHQIGRLQKNKVKYLIGKDVLIHSVDSIELAEEISRLSVKNNVDTDVLLQVNISREESKGGISPDEVYDFYDKVSAMPGVNVKGLMTVPENTDDHELLKKLFSEMNEIFVDIFGKIGDNINNYYLSMGMSHDFEVAIECGSNMVRVGTAIFGAR